MKMSSTYAAAKATIRDPLLSHQQVCSSIATQPSHTYHCHIQPPTKTVVKWQLVEACGYVTRLNFKVQSFKRVLEKRGERIKNLKENKSMLLQQLHQEKKASEFHIDLVMDKVEKVFQEAAELQNNLVANNTTAKFSILEFQQETTNNICNKRAVWLVNTSRIGLSPK